jgi:hypothetical protein
MEKMMKKKVDTFPKKLKKVKGAINKTTNVE